MKERTQLLIQRILSDRQKRRRRLALITALALLTGGNVFWDLREVGTALTEDQLCTIQAHEHTESCYDASGTLICGMDEHVHSAKCFSDANADLETPEIWEMTFTVPEEANRHEKTALIAESQLGYDESTDNFTLSEDGIRHGYTRYGEWYGNPYGDWNTMFTYFCMYYAGVTAEEMPYNGNARTWQVSLNENELICPPDSEPERGDVVLLDADGDGEADRTGIVTGTEELLTVVEGDQENAVNKVQYLLDDPQIIGFVALPEPDTPLETYEAELETDAETSLLVYSAESPSGIQVSASAEEGAFPADAVMTVTDISREDALQAAGGHLDSDSFDAVAVDISFHDAEGAELEPAEDRSVQVQITLPEEMQLGDGEYALLHVSDDGDVQKVENAEVSADGAEFATDSFSVYIVTKFSDKEKDRSREWLEGYGWLIGDTSATGYVPNEEAYPYLIRVGDKVKFYSTDSGSGFWTQFYSYERVLDDQGNYKESKYTLLSDDSSEKEKYQAIARTQEHPNNWSESGRLYAEFIGIKSGLAVVHHTINGTITENFYIRVLDREEDHSQMGLNSPANESFTHCDMEIADNGTYTVTETVNGETTITKYQAVVTAIKNDTKIYKKDGSFTVMPMDAYRKLGTPGQPQYELTSAYYAGNFAYTGTVEGHIHYEDVSYWEDEKNHKKPHFWPEGESHWGVAFNPNDVDYVVFDVELTLIPDKKFTLDSNNNVDKQEKLNPQNTTIIPNVIYRMDQQDMIDAMNKCPLSNGFDFTVRADAALVSIQALKLLDGTVPNKNFDFELLDLKDANYKFVKTDDYTAQVDLANCFSAEEGHVYLAFQLNNLQGNGAWGSGLDEQILSEFNRVTGKNFTPGDMGNMIGAFASGSSDYQGVSQAVFYSILSTYLKGENAIKPVGGKFDIVKGVCVVLDISQATSESKNKTDDGSIELLNHAFSTPGHYNYIVREKPDPTITSTLFDEKFYRICVEVTEKTIIENEDTQEQKDVSVLVGKVKYPDGQPVFNNYTTYTLPSTGGHGAMPYILGGTGLMGAALLLFLRKRKGAC